MEEPGRGKVGTADLLKSEVRGTLNAPMNFEIQKILDIESAGFRHDAPILWPDGDVHPM